MTLEAVYRQEGCAVDYTPAAATTAGTVVQLPDGRAAVVTTDLAAGQMGSALTRGRFTVQKTASISLLAGGRVFWDHSANKAHFKTVNDKDFYAGVAAEDAAASATTVEVLLNVEQKNTLDLLNGPALSVPTGTQVVGAFGYPKPFGGAQGLALTATNEAQCIDLLSVDRVAIAANGIAEFQVRIAANGSGSTVDLNIGVANGTSTSDADAIAESVFFHIDGGSTNINAESDDTTAAEVAATDTTVDLSAGSAVANRHEFWIDMRDPTDIQLYIDGVNVLPSSVFTLGGATGPIGLLVHLEKSSGTETAGPVYVDRAVLRTMEDHNPMAAA